MPKMKLKYEKEIKEVLSNVLPREDWMTDQEFNQSITYTIDIMGNEIGNSIHYGLKSGVSLEQQIQTIKSKRIF